MSITYAVSCRIIAAALALLLLRTDQLPAQSTDKEFVATVRGSLPIIVDGRLDDEIWERASFRSDFLQKDPIEFADPSVRTEVAFAYDEEYLYVAATMFIDDRDGLNDIITKRDNPSVSDRIIFSIDSYNDNRTAYSFAVTAAGVRIDYYHGSDDEYDRDFSFNPIWEASTWIGDDRWTAELKIPFSQLRFNDVEEQRWGVNINRYIPGKREDIYWVVVPKTGSGWSSKMGELTGMRDIETDRAIELFPYAAAGVGAVSREGMFDVAGGYDAEPRFTAGLDAKIGLGPDFTLDATINPDFGQVELDPAVVNLSAYETFLEERRPFFVEGSGLFSNTGSPHFYSRRIGAQPHLRFPSDSLTEQPSYTTILGAAKVTGRTSDGLSLGLLAAVTEEESASIFDHVGGVQRTHDVEPASLYTVGRISKAFGSGLSTIGAIATYTERFIDDTVLQERLAERAVTGSGDMSVRIGEGAYNILSKVAVSRVEGHERAITRIQRSSVHFNQRPDASYLEYDTTRTSMTGFAASIEFSKIQGDLVYDIGGSTETPDFELNDLGQLSSTDDLDAWLSLRYRKNPEGSVVRSWSVEGFLSGEWNFGGTRQRVYASTDYSITWANNFNNYLGILRDQYGLSDALTRGGPLMDETDLLLNVYTGMSNGYGAKTRWSWHVGYGLREYDGWFLNTRASLSGNIGDRLELSLDPQRYEEIIPRQYLFSQRRLDGADETFGNRYLFSRLHYRQLGVELRAGYIISPDLSLELYLQPFIASGDYGDIGELRAAGTGDVDWYGDRLTFDPAGGVYKANLNGEVVQIPDFDFTEKALRGTIVMRWEWLPGSTLYGVWSINGGEGAGRYLPVGPTDIFHVFTAPGEHAFVVKLSYWLPLG